MWVSTKQDRIREKLHFLKRNYTICEYVHVLTTTCLCGGVGQEGEHDKRHDGSLQSILKSAEFKDLY